MNRIREWLARRRDPRSPGEIEAELQFHLQMEVDAGLRRGLSPEEALRRAWLRAGTVSSVMDELHPRRGSWFDGLFTDLRQSVTALLHHRGFAAIAISALALAVAMNTLIFTLLDGVVLRSLPYPHSEQLVRLFETTRRNPKFPISIGNFFELQRHSRSIENIALYTGQDLQITHGEQPERLPAMRVSPGFFSTLGVTPLLGRDFQEADSKGDQRVVILGHSLWRTRFNSDPLIAGKTLRINRQEWTIAGVLPSGFQHVGGAYRSPLQGDTVALWWPLQTDLPENQQRGWHFTNAIARLKPGVSIGQAQDEMKSLSADLRRRFPNFNTMEITLRPLFDEVVGRSRETVWLVVAAGVLVLLISCANIAGLCLARSLARRKEMSVRAALGAGTWRLIRLVLAEHFLLGVAGALAGLLLAMALLPAWRSILPANFPRVHEVGFSFLAAGFAAGIALIASLIAGLAPALRQLHSDPHDHLGQESRGASSSRGANRLRAVLVTCEIALAALLCTTAALLVHSSLRLNARNHGFEPRGALTLTLALPPGMFSTPAQVVQFHQKVLDRWRALPGVSGAGLASDIPWTGYDENSSFGVPGAAPEGSASPQGRFHMASAGYFEALRIPLRRGRYFDETDRPDSARVVVINESLARRFLGEGDPIGRVLDMWGEKRRVIGVAADVYDNPADPAAEPAFWFPLTQMPRGLVVAVIRTDRDAISLLPSVTAALREIDRELPLAEAKSLEDIARAALAERVMANWLFQAFGLLALVMAVFGIYGLLSYIVEQRHKEFGIRSALGATRGDILWMVLRQALGQAAIGGLAGLILVPLAGRPLAAFLYGVSIAEPVPLILAPSIIIACAIAASLIPAIGAARARASETLRAE